MNLSQCNGDKELFSVEYAKENTMNLSQRSEDKELFSVEYAKENTMNLSQRSEDKELFSETLVKENTLFSETLVKENTNNVLYFIHSAICYNNNIELLNMKKAIHLYKEHNKDESWNKIKNNYYITLGIELINNNNENNKNKNNNNENNKNKNNNNENNKNKNNNNENNNKLKISIIGRITEEKIPINFLEKICKLSNKIYENIEINIFGEKDTIFNNDYVNRFNKLIKQSKIIVNNFVEPENIYKIYEKTDILLIPSLYETGSFTCLEAFSNGIPVIARNVYGLKHLIEHEISGYLFNNDDEILDKINELNNNRNDKLLDLHNKNRIIEISKKYNIIDKIKEFELIIDNNLKKKNLVILTSVLNCSNEPLSYYNIRSIFDINERYKHTLKSISSIKEKIPNVEILFCECSNLEKYLEIENDIKQKVDYYYNFYDLDNIRNSVNSKFKGLGEASILLESIKIIKNEISENFFNIFKLSGRYYLNSNFDYNYFDNEYNQFTNWDNNNESYCTLIYKIKNNYLIELENCLYKSLNELEKGNSIEQCMYNNFSNINLKVINKFNVSGFLATEGYLFSV
jgi:glycosyltransferase involved in cell wall biosynthesis